MSKFMSGITIMFFIGFALGMSLMYVIVKYLNS